MREVGIREFQLCINPNIVSETLISHICYDLCYQKQNKPLCVSLSAPGINTLTIIVFKPAHDVIPLKETDLPVELP
jgi:hypothetical protein